MSYNPSYQLVHDMENNTTNPNKVLVGALLALVIVLVFLAALFASQNKQTAPYAPSTYKPVSNSGPVLTGSFKFSPAAQRFALGSPITLLIAADSAGKDISGFDMLVSLDTRQWQLVTAESIDPNFQIFTHAFPDHLSITGVKNITVHTSTMFTGKPVVKLIVRAKKQGTYPITLLPQVGLEKSKMVDAQSNILAPQLDTVTLAIF